MNMRIVIRMKHKGQANIVSGLVLAVAVIATWTLILSWAHFSLETLQRSVFEETTHGIEALKENLVIEDLIPHSNWALIAIRNVGMNNIKISHVYINDTEVTINSIIIDGAEYPPDTAIDMGKYAYINVTFTYTQASYIRVTIVSERGVNYYSGFEL